MAGNKKFNILIVPPTSGDTIQINIPQLVVSLIGFVLICGVLLFGFLLLQYFQVQDSAQQLDALKAENSFLQGRLTRMQSSVATFGQYLGEIEQTENDIRMVFGIPEIDPAERALGIGGFPSVPDSPLNDYQQLSYDTEADIEDLLRRVRFERANFDEIYESLVDRKDRLDHTPSIMPSHGYYSSGFGMRRHPFTGKRCMHRGADFAAPTGTPIIASADGRVASIKYNRDFGKTLIIDHGYGIRTVYCHLSKAEVKAGQEVKRGDTIALMGNSGLSTGPHLHYEVHLDGKAANPMSFIYDIPSFSRTEM